MFKKTCFVCGKKVDVLYDGKCEDCYRYENPPVVEIKPINLKFCNGCMKIYYGNALYERDEIEAKIPDIVKKNLIIDKNYKLNEVRISDFEIQGEKVSFDVEVDCSLKEN